MTSDLRRKRAPDLVAASKPPAENIAEARECWICYGGESDGELISPCRCRGSLQWVHRACLQTWITTRVVQVWPEAAGRGAGDRFACPNCESPFQLVRRARAADGNEPAGDSLEIWPSGRLWPRIGLLQAVDKELAYNFQRKFLEPLACTAIHLLLLSFTAAQIICLLLDVNADGWGADVDLKDVTTQGMHQSPVLVMGLNFLFGPTVVENPIVSSGPIGTISKKWSMAFSSIQHVHAMLMMASFALHLWGCYDWFTPGDLAPVPPRLRLQIFRIDAFYFLFTVNPPIFRCVRVLTINVLVPFSAGWWPPAQPTLLWVVYSLFSSHFDVAWHSATALILLVVYYKAMKREHAAIAKQMETIWSIHTTEIAIGDNAQQH